MGKVKFRKKKIDTILDIFAWLSFFAALIVSIAAILATFSSESNGKEIFGRKLLIVESDSMSKAEENQEEDIFFSAGDVIIIKTVEDFSTIQVGDVITFVSYNPDSRGKVLSHKVRSIKASASGIVIGFETYGINTGVSDEALVDTSTVIGKYVGKIPKLGTLFKFFKTPAGFFLSVSIPSLLLIIFFSIKVGKQLGKKEMSDTYDKEIERLKERLLGIENIGDGEEMRRNRQETPIVEKPEHPQTATPQTETAAPQPQMTANGGQPVYPFLPQPMMGAGIQIPTFNDKPLELTINALTATIETLTRTIETLASNVEKPVVTLANTVQTLANATSKPTVVEKVVEKVVSIPIEKKEEKTPIETIEEQPIIEKVVPAKEEIAATKIEEPLAVETEEKATGLNSLVQREKIPFNKKLLSLDSEIKNYFSEVHNEIISHKKVNYRISVKGISYKTGRKALAKMVVRGKTLKLHLALNVNDYPKTVYFQEDLGNVKAYEEVPFTVKIKSNRAKNNALKLVSALAENNSLVKNEQAQKENILKQLKQIKK